MATAIEHYERLLAEHYTWMSGGLDNAVARNRTTLLGLGVQARGGGARAIDLGAGSGAQSLALAQLGFEVWAVDSSEPLLAELGRHESATHVCCVHADMTELARIIHDTASDRAGIRLHRAFDDRREYRMYFLGRRKSCGVEGQARRRRSHE